jgi:thymidylate kinase
MSKIISIEGNIGSGKSTLVSILKETLKDSLDNRSIVFLQEPVDEWESIKDSNGITMLEKFYQDQERYSFPFQMMAYISRLALLKNTVKNNPEAIILTERSLYTDKHVFAKMLYDSGKIEDVNYQIYLKWFETFASDFPIDGIVYIRSNPEICKERIQKRSRTGEDVISLDYLSSCNMYHDKMVEMCQTVLVLDGNLDIKNMKETWVNLIQEFIK